MLLMFSHKSQICLYRKWFTLNIQHCLYFPTDFEFFTRNTVKAKKNKTKLSTASVMWITCVYIFRMIEIVLTLKVPTKYQINFILLRDLITFKHSLKWKSPSCFIENMLSLKTKQSINLTFLINCWWNISVVYGDVEKQCYVMTILVARIFSESQEEVEDDKHPGHP